MTTAGDGAFMRGSGMACGGGSARGITGEGLACCGGGSSRGIAGGEGAT